jgi:hypothetical protein
MKVVLTVAREAPVVAITDTAASRRRKELIMTQIKDKADREAEAIRIQKASRRPPFDNNLAVGAVQLKRQSAFPSMERSSTPSKKACDFAHPMISQRHVVKPGHGRW